MEADTLSRISLDSVEGDKESFGDLVIEAILVHCSCQSDLFEPEIGYLSTCKESLTQSVGLVEIILNKKVGVAPLIRLLMLNGCKNRVKDPIQVVAA